MEKRTSLNKILIMILLVLSIVCFGLFTACSTPKGPTDPDDPDENPSGGGGEQEMHVVVDDAYFCKATGRFMASKTDGGDLIPVSLALEDGETLTFNGQEVSELNVDKTFVEGLQTGVEHEILITKPDGKTITYKAQVAERVIVRFSNTDKYTNKTVYGNDVSNAQDYLYDFNVTAASGTKTGKSIFSFSSTFKNSKSAVRWANASFGGLYVLANDINFTDEPSVTRHVSISTNSSNNGHWVVDTTFDTIDGKRDSCYYLPRQGYGFIGTFDGRGKVIDTNGRNTSIGILPPAYGATIKNVAVINAYAYYWASESPLVCSAKNTTFENIYVSYKSITSTSNEGNKPMLTCLESCTLKNYVVDCDLLNIDKFLVFGGKINSDENSGYGQGRETTGVFSFVDFSEVNATGTDVVDGHSFANAVAGDAFVGTTAVNVYAVGSTPLYINQEMDFDENGVVLRPTMRTTVFVNKMLKYKSGTQLLDCNQTDFYKEELFYGTEYEDQVDELVSISEHAKRQRYGVEIFKELSRKDDYFYFRFINKEGFFDAQNKNEMKAQVLKNKNDGKEQFDAKYWNVANDGTVSWKGLN